MNNVHNLRVGYDNILKRSGVAISASTAAVGLPASNILHPYRTKIWQGTSNSDETLYIDFGDTYTVQDIFMFNVNVKEMHAYDPDNGLSFGVTGSTNAAHSPVGVGGVIDYSENINTLHYRFTSAQNMYRYWKFDIIWEGGSFGDNPNAEVGYAYMGVAVDLPYSPDVHVNYKDPSSNVYSIDGQRAAFVRSRFRTVDFTIEEGLAPNTTNLVALFDAVGFSTDFVLSLDPLATAFALYPDAYYDYVMYGRLTNWNMQHVADGAYRVTVSFEEAR
jgi:hypothetical protein